MPFTLRLVHPDVVARLALIEDCSQITLDNVKGVFIMLAIGYVLAFVFAFKKGKVTTNTVKIQRNNYRHEYTKVERFCLNYLGKIP